MKSEAIKNREEIAEIKRKFKSGEISYDQAKAEMQPVLDRINAKSAEIAKKYNKKTVPKVSFAAIMR
jgi:polyhydroxyalkanoate synthesis regulator phasin